jgi:hypothetical protein
MTISVPFQRIASLLYVAEGLGAPMDTQLRVEALKSVQLLDNPGERGKVLHDLIAVLPRDALEFALRVAGGSEESNLEEHLIRRQRLGNPGNGLNPLDAGPFPCSLQHRS